MYQSNDPGGGTSRRNFLTTGFKVAGAAVLAGSSLDALAAKKEYTVQNIIDIILKEIPGAPISDTVDTLKSGTAGQNVTGIVTTMFATIDIVRKAATQRANFIIAHEPTFYNHSDDTKWTGENKIVRQKQELLKKHGIAVWRFHDYWHRHKPDGIIYGVLKKMNWVAHNSDTNVAFTIPPSGLGQLANELKLKLGIERVRVIGDPAANIQKVALMPGAWGGHNHITTIEKEQPDLVIVGELQEWETAEYIRDARALGSKISLIVLGHSVSEEPGMEWLATWLQPRLQGLSVTHLPSGNPFIFI